MTAGQVDLGLGDGGGPRLAYDGGGRPVGTVSDVEPAGQLAEDDK